MNRTRTLRGLSLVELTVALTLIGLVAVAVVQLTVNAAQQSTSSQTRSAAAADIADAQHRLRNLILNTQSCEPDRLDYPVRELTPTHLNLVTDTNNDAYPDFVHVDASGPDLQLFTITGDATTPCDWPDFTDVQPETLLPGDFTFTATTATGTTITNTICDTDPDYTDCRLIAVEVAGVVHISDLTELPFAVKAPISPEWGRR